MEGRSTIENLISKKVPVEALYVKSLQRFLSVRCEMGGEFFGHRVLQGLCRSRLPCAKLDRDGQQEQNLVPAKCDIKHSSCLLILKGPSGANILSNQSRKISVLRDKSS